MKFVAVALSLVFLSSCSQFRPKEHYEAIHGTCTPQADGSLDCTDWVGYKNLREDGPLQEFPIKDNKVVGDYYDDGCVGIDATPWCNPEAPPEQVAAFLAPVVDPAEEKLLKQLKPLIIADAGTTIVGLLKCAVKEANPLLGSSPAPLIVAGFGVLQWKVFENCAEKTPIYASCAGDLKVAAIMRYIAVANNAYTLAVCL